MSSRQTTQTSGSASSLRTCGAGGNAAAAAAAAAPAGAAAGSARSSAARPAATPSCDGAAGGNSAWFPRSLAVGSAIAERGPPRRTCTHRPRRRRRRRRFARAPRWHGQGPVNEAITDDMARTHTPRFSRLRSFLRRSRSPRRSPWAAAPFKTVRLGAGARVRAPHCAACAGGDAPSCFASCFYDAVGEVPRLRNSPTEHGQATLL
jgi:hypothetical protein